MLFLLALPVCIELLAEIADALNGKFVGVWEREGIETNRLVVTRSILESTACAVVLKSSRASVKPFDEGASRGCGPPSGRDIQAFETYLARKSNPGT